MGLRMNYSIDDVAAKAFLDRLGAVDTRVMFDQVGGYLDSQTAERFSAGEDWQGNPLIPSQRAIDKGGITLVKHGHLRDSYTHNVFNDGMGVEHGSDMVYAAIHHFGGNAGRNRSVELEPRPVMGINDDDELMIDDIVRKFYLSMIDKT